MTKKQTDIGRREFLRNTMVIGGAAAVAVVTGEAVAAPVAKPAAPEPTKTESKGYHVTEHIKEYYRTAGL